MESHDNGPEVTLRQWIELKMKEYYIRHPILPPKFPF